MTPTFDQIIQNSKVIVCAGSGGVGKTTLSAALAVRATQLGKQVLVLTVDPAQRLATALGLDLKNHEVRKVELEASGQLSAAVIDSKKTFDAFVVRHSSNEELAQRLLKNRLYQQLSTTLSGSQEFTSLERLYEAYESKRYDLIVLDTPPTKHAIDFLRAPDRLNNLFQDSVTKWFMMASGGEKSGFFTGLINKGTRTVLKSLETLTGSQFIDELVDFFASMRNLQKVLRERSQSAQKLLLGTETSFIVVTSFDAAKLAEAHYLQEQLRSMGYRLAAVIINRAFPMWLKNSNEGDSSTSASLNTFYETFRNYHSERYDLYEKFEKTVGESVRIVRIPEYNQDVYGLEGLERLAEQLAQTT